MEKDIYIRRTPAGEAAAIKGAVDNRRALNILRLIEGVTSTAVFKTKLRNYGDIHELVEHLVQLEFLEVVDQQANPLGSWRLSSAGKSLKQLFGLGAKKPALEAVEPETLTADQPSSEISEGGIPLPNVEYLDDGSERQTEPQPEPETTPGNELEDEFINRYAPNLAGQSGDL